MKKMRVAYGIGCICLIVLLLSGCGTRWKKTTDLSLRYELVRENAELDYLRFDGGSIYLERLKWEGEREQAGDVEFVEEFESTLHVNAGVDAGDLDVTYQIPQGTYNNIDVELRLNGRIDHSGSVVLKGVYLPLSGDTITWVFDTQVTLDLDLETIFPNGESSISLIKGTPQTATIRMHVADWFANTTENMFASSERTNTGGEERIVISKDQNLEIYDAVIGRIGQTDLFDLN